MFFLKATVDYIQKDNSLSNLQMKVHGEGSYALVYRYEDPNYNKKIIIKRAKKSISEKELERFKQEFKSLKTLNSPYIVKFLNMMNKKMNIQWNIWIVLWNRTLRRIIKS
ncbi:Protein kinase domain [Staphylococcus simulans]|nr:Protein kinase domain [Staphylococcus simulans]